MIFADDFWEHENIAWRMEPGKCDPCNPLIEPKYPWDAGAVFSHGTVHKDPIDGLYKAWYLSTPPSPATNDRQLTYAYSEDGINWTRPELDIYPCDSYEKTNILLGSRMGGQVSQVSVFIHPDAEPERRYEMFCYRDPLYYQWQTPGYGCPDHRIEGLDLPEGHKHHYYGLYRHWSSDGLHWKPESIPIAGSADTRDAYGGKPFVSSDGLSVFQLRDGRYVVHNKVELPAIPGGYVMYDVGAGGCRTIARRESPDAVAWGHTYENIVTPDYLDPADTQFMELMMNEYNDGFIAVATVYHTWEGTIDLQLATSSDGHKWWRPSRRPCISLAPLGDIGGGMLWPMRGFTFDGDKTHLYYGAMNGLHSDIYSHTPTCGPFIGAICRATWETGRMWGAIHYGGTAEPAWLTKLPHDVGGKTLYINARTRNGGSVEAELLNISDHGEVTKVAGYSAEDCNAFTGDDKCAALTWKGKDKVNVEKAGLRIILKDAILYGFEWR